MNHSKTDCTTGETSQIPLTQEEIDARSVTPVPAKVSRMQARLALNDAGLLDDVEAAVTAAGGEVAIYWADVSELHRDHPLVASIGTAAGLTDEQIDDLFIAAAAIV